MKSLLSHASKVSRYPAYLRQAYWLVRTAQMLRWHGVKTLGAVACYGIPIVQRAPRSEIVIGDGVTLCSDSRYTALGVSKPVILRTLRSGARLEIGSETGLSGVVICASKSIVIGRQCLLGADVMVFDTDFHPLDPHRRRFASEDAADSRPVEIHDNVFIGARSIVLKGVTIGEGSVVGAGSIVSRDIPPFTVAAGNPARPLRELRHPYRLSDGCVERKT